MDQHQPPQPPPSSSPLSSADALAQQLHGIPLSTFAPEQQRAYFDALIRLEVERARLEKEREMMQRQAEFDRQLAQLQAAAQIVRPPTSPRQEQLQDALYELAMARLGRERRMIPLEPSPFERAAWDCGWMVAESVVPDVVRKILGLK